MVSEAQAPSGGTRDEVRRETLDAARAVTPRSERAMFQAPMIQRPDSTTWQPATAAVDEWEAVTRVAMNRLLIHAGRARLANTEEFTFRAFCMDAANTLLDRRPESQTEWNKFDPW
jgi:hypothetical protein